MAFRLDTVTSASNPWIKRLRHAASHRTPVPGDLAVAESPNLLHEAIRSDAHVERVFVIERLLDEIAATLPPHRRIPVHPVSEAVFRKVATTARSQGVLALVKLPSWSPQDVFGGLALALDGVQDPGNAGTIVRSAEAFGASGVVFLKGSAAPENPKALRAAAGSLFRMPFLDRIDPQEFLDLARSHGKAVYCAEARGRLSLHDADLSTEAAVVIGSETHGVGPSVSAAATGIAIPTQGVDSLNASIAASVILYEFARKGSPR